MEDHEKIKELFARYLADQCSREEVHLLLQYFNAEENKALLESLIKDEWEAAQHTSDENDPETAMQLGNVYQNIKDKLKRQNK